VVIDNKLASIVGCIDEIYLHIAYTRQKSIGVKKASHHCEAYKYWWPGAESNCRHADFQSYFLLSLTSLI